MSELAWPSPALRNDVVALRPWEQGDVPDALMGFADPLTHRMSWPQAEPYTPDDARNFFAEQDQQRRDGHELHLALTTPDGHTVLGGASLYDVSLSNHQAAIGYWLAAHARGRGVATHATRLLARWAFQTLQLTRLELTCSPDNLASQAVAERCGFTRQRLIPNHIAFKNGRRDSVLFHLHPNDLTTTGAAPR